MKKPVLASLLFTSLMMSGAAALADYSCPAISVPSNFSANEKFFTIGTDLTLKTGNSKFGAVIERTLNWTRTFEIQNASGQIVARAHEKMFSWGTQIVVEDCAGQKIGTVKEEVFKSLFHPYTSYTVLDAQDREIATSKKVEWLATNFDLRATSGADVGSMHRPWLNLLTDKWDVTYNASSGVDPRLWLTIPAYKTAADNDRRQKEKDDEDRRSRENSSLDGDSRDSKPVASEDEASGTPGTPGTSGKTAATERAI